MPSLKLISTNKYLLAKTGEMRAYVHIYANSNILEAIKDDLSLEQLKETASLTDVVSPVIGMPDIHQGFGLPIGGVMATNGLISVGAVGMDINCGVRILTSQLNYQTDKISSETLAFLIKEIEKLVPAGLGTEHKNHLRLNLKEVVSKGVPYLVNEGYALSEDPEHTEENGHMLEGNYEALSPRAIQRAAKQLGTLGSGNHFIDVLKIEEIFDQATASQWGLFENQVCIMIHSGSRALGHQTCLDYTNLFWGLRNKYGIYVPRPGLAALPVETPEGKKYFGAMAACVNFAFCNRQMMTYFVRQAFEKQFGQKLNLLYDVAHNIAKWEEYDGKKMLVHRKGATRAFPANHPQNPKVYMNTGHPAIVPGSMGTPSYIMVGLPKNKETFHSINHGAGRLMSRTQAKKTIKESDFDKSMEGILHNKPFYHISDEAPQVYKNIDEIVNILVEAGLSEKVAKLKPLAVING